jgi:hypothetical protein
MGAQASTPEVAVPADGAKPRAAIRGFERWATMTDYGSSKIVHAMRVKATDPKKLLQHVPTAAMRAFNTHPRMRALQVRDEFATVEIQPPFDSLDAFLGAQSQRPLLSVEEKHDAESDLEWAEFAQQECEVPFDRYSQLPFYLVVWADSSSGEARLMLFSDHYMSDGISGMVVLNDILEQATELAHDTAAAPPLPLPLRPSLYNMWLDSSPLSTALSEWVVGLLQSTILNQFGQKGGYRALIPARSDQQDFSVPPKVNPSYALFEEGTPEALASALAACKRESTTYSGALVAAVVAAYYHSAQATGHLSDASKDVFKLVASANYNMRKRVPVPAPEDHVGSFFVVNNLERLAKEGVAVSTVKFWDLARTSKKDVDVGVSASTSAFTEIFLDQTLNSAMTPEMFEGIPIEKSYTTDINISSVGKYPYAKEHHLREGDSNPWVRVESLHIYDSVPHLSGSMFFVTSVHAANYAMMHKYEDADGAAVFESLVAMSEKLGEIPSDATVLDAIKLIAGE